ncbi:MAG: hypothetical protein WBQ16_08180 [Nitrososphaeraceae archaeon]
MNTKRKLSEYKRAVLTTMTMRLSRQEALAYLRGEGYPISNSTLGRIKSELKRNALGRMHQIAAYEFHEQHLNRIDTCELIAKLIWQEYLRERSPYRRVLILKEIKEIQPYLSSYYQTTKMVLESKYGLDENNPSPSSNDKSSDDRPKIPPVRDRDE